MWRLVFHSMVKRAGKGRAGTFWPRMNYGHDRRGDLSCTHENALCRILRRQDRPTAHSRHGNMQAHPGRRRDTNRRWRQVTKLPRPFPQYLPFTLRYGYLRCVPRLRRYQRRTAAQVSLVPLMLSF